MDLVGTKREKMHCGSGCVEGGRSGCVEALLGVPARGHTIPGVVGKNCCEKMLNHINSGQFSMDMRVARTS